MPPPPRRMRPLTLLVTTLACTAGCAQFQQQNSQSWLAQPLCASNESAAARFPDPADADYILSTLLERRRLFAHAYGSDTRDMTPHRSRLLFRARVARQNKALWPVCHCSVSGVPTK